MKAIYIFLIIFFSSFINIISESDSIFISFETAGPGYTISEDTITITEEGTFNLNGTINDKKILVSSSCSLNLNEFNLFNNGKLTPIIIGENKRVNLILTEFNLLSDSPENENEGTIYLQKGASLIISGTGTLSINPKKNMAINGTEGTSLTVNDGAYISILSETSKGGGIYLRKEIIFNKATYIYNCPKGEKHSIDTEGDISLIEGLFDIDSGKGKGIQAENNLYIGKENGKDEDLTLSIKTSNEGIEAKVITINSGSIYIDSGEDGINASSSGNDCGETVKCSGNCVCKIYIKGGELAILAEGDGIDANGDITISGGVIQIFAASQTQGGNQPIDQDGLLKIEAGTIIAAGTPSMGGVNAQTNQIAKIYNGNIKKGNKIIIFVSGVEVFNIEAPKDANYIYFNYKDSYTVKIDNTQISLTEPSQNQQQQGENPNGNPPAKSSVDGFGNFLSLSNILFFYGFILL